MLLKFRSPFKLKEKNDHDHHGHKPSRSSCNKTNHDNHEMKNSTAVGLRIIVQSVPGQGDQNHSNVVVKSARRLNQPATKNSALDEYYFLKICNLCNKGLSLDKEVYMYRGDQAFCSVECRHRQIFLDEMRELEASTKKMIASYRSSCNPATNETRLEELRQRHHKPNPNHRRNRAVVIP